MRNLNLLFNKTYYEALTASSFADKTVMKESNTEANKKIYGTTFSHARDYAAPGEMVRQRFLMTVCYPGLLVGIGNAHNAGVSSEEIAVGFSFDYVTGQPYIPGSTVKGVLRSHFKDHPQVIMALYEQDQKWVQALEAEIFEGEDIFFDAVVYDGARYGCLMGSEFITPHSSPTENPVPIKLIKVLPDVRFEFRFRLKDSEHMTAAEKEKLFRELLTRFGIGAKTNVGFGILKKDETDGRIDPKEPLPPEDKPSAQQHRDRPREAPAARQAERDGKKCPRCGKWNRRVDPKTGKENWNWSKNICFICKEKME